MDQDIRNILRVYAGYLVDNYGKEVDTLTVSELAPWPLSQVELDFVFSEIDHG